MKIAKYDLIFKIKKQSSNHKRKRQLSRIVSRAKLIKAFAVPGVAHNTAKEIVARYIGPSPVPPRWNSLGVKATFGKRIQSLWARHISCLPAATYKSGNNRDVTPDVHTIHEIQKSTGIFYVDEFWHYAQSPVSIIHTDLRTQK